MFTSPSDALSHEAIIAAVRTWLEKAVIGLNLCPFAKAVHIKDQIAYRVSDARDPDALLEDLASALRELAQSDPERVDTLLLVHPWTLADFHDYNDFLDDADAAVEALGLAGEIQVASFHPDYQFADTEPDDIENYSNRSPYPILHLLREASVDRAVEAFPDAERIYEHNIETLRELGLEGWKKLGL
ncbi:MAG: DUF1415 domain-containing protein [Pigmentiphaga sp.]|uniref:DUF1415 domain-containing protein n=1 Tax=Pigmentiphaga sp. TaxID=1977564 RepID=UPI0029A1DF52|nr:DUF1415 domain-containing protein [Pigmentiphaga sp.]MDX3905232.1 DUF1415 domain-containing protein [Pigmentiphaga sp.]